MNMSHFYRHERKGDKNSDMFIFWYIIFMKEYSQFH